MKSIIGLPPDNYGISAFYVILAYYISIVLCVPSCGLYGAAPCQFLPAPPGQTPSCARPGKTYCEHVDNYPTYLIKHLVHKWGYEAKRLIVDETWEDYAATIWPQSIPVFYDPAYIFPQKQRNRVSNNNNDAFIGYNYEIPLQQRTQPQNNYLYNKAAVRNQVAQPHSLDHLKVTPYNAVYQLKRIARDLRNNVNATSVQFNDLNTIANNTSRDVSINMDLLDIVGVSREAKNRRTKRQSPGRTTLCQTNSQFITPQAALNNKGNWMFVVNEANTARQQVKAELCASNTCTNICQLPNGYTSRCEQKFVQKRLIALQGNGQNLYTDSFWFPSCCVCTISADLSY